jgi:hypothetical protein
MFDVAQNTENWAGAYGLLPSAQRVFVDAYLADLEDEARRTDNHILLVLSERSLTSPDKRQAALLAAPGVRAAIVERAREIASATHLNRSAVVREWAKIAFFNAHDAVKIGMSGYAEIDLTQLTVDQWAAVSAVEVEENPRGGRKVKVKFHDKVAALKEFSRMTGLDSDDYYREQSSKIKHAFNMTNDISEAELADGYAQLLNEE